VLTCAFPIEKYLSRVPSAYEEGDNTHRIYQALARVGGCPAAVPFGPCRSGSRHAGWSSGRGYVVLTNHSGAAQTVTVTARKAPRRVGLVTTDAAAPLELHGNAFTVRVAPFGGEIVEYQESQQ
jgi:hypothetical protein